MTGGLCPLRQIPPIFAKLIGSRPQISVHSGSCLVGPAAAPLAVGGRESWADIIHAGFRMAISDSQTRRGSLTDQYFCIPELLSIYFVSMRPLGTCCIVLTPNLKQ